MAKGSSFAQNCWGIDLTFPTAEGPSNRAIGRWYTCFLTILLNATRYTGVKGDGDAADNIIGGPAHSTLSADAFRSHEFDSMLSNPPYGKSWKSDLDLRSDRATASHDRISLILRSGNAAPRPDSRQTARGSAPFSTGCIAARSMVSRKCALNPAHDPLLHPY